MAYIRRNYSKKTGELISIFIQVYGGTKGENNEAAKKAITVKIPKGLSARAIERFIKEQELEFEKKCNHGFSPNSKLTFKKYAKDVLVNKQMQGVKQTTLDRYEELLVRINEAIGHMKLDEIMPSHLNKLYNDLAKPGANKKTGTGLSSKTILEHHRVISTIMDSAFKEMLIEFNPAQRATPPRPEKKAPNYFQIEQLNSIRKCADHEPINHRLMIYLFMTTGCRRGEILGLKWENYDKSNRLLLIDSTILKSNGNEKKIYETTPKTKTSVRYIKLPEILDRMLDEYRVWQKSEQERWGDIWIESPYILTATMGGPLYPDTINDYFKKFEKRYNLDFHINPHAFRHSAASILIAEGIDVVTVSNLLGHASPSTTTAVYSHEIAAAKAKAEAILTDKLL